MNTDIRWLAGFFDGEGTVYAWVQDPERQYDRPNRRTQLTVLLAQANRQILEEINADFPGGGIIAQRRDGRIFCHTLRWGGGTAKPFLRSVLPHLRLKKHLAELGLAWIANDSNSDAGVAIAQEIRSINGERRKPRMRIAPIRSLGATGTRC